MEGEVFSERGKEALMGWRIRDQPLLKARVWRRVECACELSIALCVDAGAGHRSVGGQ